MSIVCGIRPMLLVGWLVGVSWRRRLSMAVEDCGWSSWSLLKLRLRGGRDFEDASQLITGNGI